MCETFFTLPRAEHRIRNYFWGAEGGTLMLTQRERIRRWRYVWLLDVDEGASRLWFDLDEDDSYGDPGYPEFRQRPNGRWVMHQNGDAVYFSGSGATEQGDRPFLDLRHLDTSETRRLFRCDPNRYERFVSFAGDEDRFVLSSESAVDVPNYYLATFGKEIEASEGEATRTLTRVPITHFEDPTPRLREIEKRIVRYEREDGVPLSFQLHLPPGYKEGTPLPTVLYAYPLEYSGATTAGQVRGSTQRFMRLYGASHLYFLLRGYAGGEKWMMGHMYIFNNTIFQEHSNGAGGLGGDSRIIKHCTTRNNILHVREEDHHSIAVNRSHLDNDFDYDLTSAAFPDGHQQHGLKGVPRYVEGAGFDPESRTGMFQLAPGSKGVDAGVVIPNFCEVINGNWPDLGVHESGTRKMRFGVRAQFVPLSTLETTRK
jgi:hypothetical protein